jgi:hypothetical protein
MELKSYSCINAIQLWACRFFLGVGRYTPNAAVMGDMGWTPIYHTQWKIISSQWCKLVNMGQNRTNRKIFVWADEVNLKSKSVKNWNYVVRKHFTDLELAVYCNLNRDINKRFLNDFVMSKMFLKYTESWHTNVNAVTSMTGNGRNKLRTYKLFKSEYGVANDCKVLVPFNDRSAFAKFRCGVAPIRLETGRYENVRLEERCCFNCSNLIEDETHVILHCPVYSDFRNNLFTEVLEVNRNFMSLSDCQKMVFFYFRI